MPKKVKHWRCLVNLAAPWVWGIGRNLELHCEIVIVLAGSCSKAKQAQNHHVFNSVFCTSMASVSQQVLDLVTTQSPDFITKLDKIAGVFNTTLLSFTFISFVFYVAQKASKSILKVTRFVKI